MSRNAAAADADQSDRRFHHNGPPPQREGNDCAMAYPRAVQVFKFAGVKFLMKIPTARVWSEWHRSPRAKRSVVSCEEGVGRNAVLPRSQLNKVLSCCLWWLWLFLNEGKLLQSCALSLVVENVEFSIEHCGTRRNSWLTEENSYGKIKVNSDYFQLHFP